MSWIRQISLFSSLAILILTDMAWATTISAVREDEYRKLALSQAKIYVRPALYIYAPHSDSKERAASTVAVSGHILLEAYLASGDKSWLDKARASGDSLIAHPDMNGDGAWGWGRYWPADPGRPSFDGKGGNTSFVMGCIAPRNKAYDDEIYDDARVGHFLLDLYLATSDRRYLAATQRMIDDTWHYGETTPGGGFYYYKTIGACDRGWHVKNINMLMAVPMAQLAKVTGDAKYRLRLRAMLRAEAAELDRTVDGKPAPNFGYYAVQTMLRRPTQGTYVSRAQTTDLRGPIRCNDQTGSGLSCAQHIGLEARSIDLVDRILGDKDAELRHEAQALMAELRRDDPALCGAEKTAKGYSRNWTACAAYYCALRRLSPDYNALCRERAAKEIKPDTVLGLFWGRPDRFTR